MQINWNSAAPRSIFDTTTKATYLGTRNLQVPGRSQISPFMNGIAESYVPHSPKALALASKAPPANLRVPKMVLSPIEALEIKYNQPKTLESLQMVTYSLPGETQVIWRGRKIVRDRVLGTPGYLFYLYATSNELGNLMFQVTSSNATDTSQRLVESSTKSQTFTELLNAAANTWTYSKLANNFNNINLFFLRAFMTKALDYADRIFEAQVDDAELVFIEAIRAIQGLYLNSEKAPPAFKSRFKTNGVVLNPQHAATNSGTFSIKPNKQNAESDPEMDFLLNTYAKCIVDTRAKDMNRNVIWPQDSAQTFTSEDLGKFYPVLNLSSDGLVAKTDAPIIGQLYMARVWVSKLSTQKVRIGSIAQDCSIGSKLALLGMFLLASQEEKLVIAKSIYRKMFGDNLATPLRSRVHSSSTSVKMGSINARIDYRYLLGQILYLDSFNHINLMRQTVAYLLWVKNKVNLAENLISQSMLKGTKSVSTIKNNFRMFPITNLPSTSPVSSKDKPTSPSLIKDISTSGRKSPFAPIAQVNTGLSITPSRTQDTTVAPEPEIEVVEEPEIEIIDEDLVDVEIVPLAEPVLVELELDEELPQDLSLDTIATSQSEPTPPEEEASETKATSNTKVVVGSAIGVALLAGGVWWYQKNKR